LHKCALKDKCDSETDADCLQFWRQLTVVTLYSVCLAYTNGELFQFETNRHR